MSNTAATYLADYQAPAFFIEKTQLFFDLQDAHTDVKSVLHIVRNTEVAASELILQGELLELLAVVLNDQPLTPSQYQLTEHDLRIADLPAQFVLQITTRIYPDKNTALEGLYRSSGMYCTQCEAEGFRKITYYLDRPDVMSEFETTITADENAYRVMLSNGNCVSDRRENGKRIVHWHDPFKKPSYLFALVAGNLSVLEDRFTTASGRDVLLQIFVEDKDLDKCDFAMDSLKRSMRWDEEVYGREYDLDRFMIVAVDDFNMGAMENKGLNVFNTSCVLAHPQTTTDLGFQRVEAVVAHEYFHNWSGNRVTCRDWFQLSLKEGFTVYRDAQFSADMNSAAVKRIEDVSFLRSVQFVEDAGPMAHPVRPDSFIEISNFYTVTIYEKGAEVVRILANILGPQLFRKATDLYFARFDGQAVTCDDFVQCMQEVSGKDLSQFKLWYSQAGTPQLHVADSYDAATQQYTLNVSQTTPATPGQADKKPFHIPVKTALYGKDGALPLVIGGEQLGLECVLDITKANQSIVFEQVTERPVPSLLRDFSAPVKVFYDYTPEALQQLILLDDDGFGRWDAMQSLMTLVLRRMIDQQDCSKERALLSETLRQLLARFEEMDAALLAMMLDIPTENYLSEFYQKADPVRISRAREDLQNELAKTLSKPLLACYTALENHVSGMTGAAMSARALRNRALFLLLQLDNSEYRQLAEQQFIDAETMTDQFAALRALVHSPFAESAAEKALAAFYQQWQQEALVVNMWLQVQATKASPDSLNKVKALLQHPAFDMRNPNKVRSVISAFCGQNFAGFHDASGAAYQFLAEQVAVLNQSNPQIASRLLTPLTHWHKFNTDHAMLMQQSLKTLQAQPLSKDVYEVVTKSLASLG